MTHISYLSVPTNYAKLSGLRTTKLSTSQCLQVRNLGAASRAPAQGFARAVGILRLHRGGSDAKLIHRVVGTIQSLMDCWTEGLSSSGNFTATENEHRLYRTEEKWVTDML